MNREEISRAYQAVRHSCRSDWGSRAASDAIIGLAITSLQFLIHECRVVPLISAVPGKQYMTFGRSNVVARPANRDLFIADPDAIANGWYSWLHGGRTVRGFDRIMYTIALAPCLAMELFDRNNKKGPATFFEHLIGHMFTKSLGMYPNKRANLMVLGHSVQLTMDFLFESSDGSPSVHLPVKMSTRERVVQAWSHQRLLDSAFGLGAYRGIMVVFSETKLDSRSHEVVEICVPGQWLVYQKFLASMDVIYYFDLPVRYGTLTDSLPDHIQIKEFSTFTHEIESVVSRDR